MDVTFARCRELARMVKRARHGREVLNTVRPRNGLIRKRLPLALLIYAAARDGRTVYCGPDGFAVLQPPLGRRAGTKHPWLRRLDRYWGFAVAFLPPGVAYAGIAVLALIGRGLIFVLLLALFVVLWTGTIQLASLVGEVLSAIRIRLRPVDRYAARNLPEEHWSMVLCHQPNGAATGDMMRAVTARLHRLSEQQGGVPAGTLVCLLGSVTTDEMRQEVMAAAGELRPYGEDSEHVAFVVSAGGVSKPRREPFDLVGGFLAYAATLLVMILVLSWMVADAEAEAIEAAAACTARPTTFPLALRWLLSRTLLHDPPGLAPVTPWAIFMGWLISIASLMGAALMIRAIRQRRTVHASVIDDLDAEIARLHDQKRVLVVVSDIATRDAVLESAGRQLGLRSEMLTIDDHTVFQFKAVAETRLMVVQSGRGTLGPDSSTLTAEALIRAVRPDTVIGIGAAHGLGVLHGRDGDIVVATRLRVVGDGFRPGERGREDIAGDYVPPSTRLLDRFNAATYGWRGPAVHFGPVLSANVPVNTSARRADALATNPEAIAAETDGAGIYAAAQKQRVDWIVVKTVGASGCAAADLVVHMLKDGAFQE